MFSPYALFVLIPLISAFSYYCDQYDQVAAGPYYLSTNLWGENDATSGWQCSVLESVDGNNVEWFTEWDWSGGTSVKSFSNIQLNVGVNQQLSAISTMQSYWYWSQNVTCTETIVSNVAYDLFTSDTAWGSNLNEIMIWLANFNADPISYQYDAGGEPIPIQTGLDIAGYTWNLYSGTNGANAVYSFVPVSDTITSFSEDIYDFFTCLIDNRYVNSYEYLKTAQAGTEATSGCATLYTSAYSLSIN